MDAAQTNPMGTDGFAFVEYAHPEPEKLHALFRLMGFAPVAKHRTKAITVYRQGDVDYLVNEEPGTHAASFAAAHGPCAASMGFRVVDAGYAYRRALELGAEPADPAEGSATLGVPALKGIGGLSDSVTEDMATGLKFHSRRNPQTKARWKSVYTPDVLAVGEGPSSWGEFLSQQMRLSRRHFAGLLTAVWRGPGAMPLITSYAAALQYNQMGMLTIQNTGIVFNGPVIVVNRPLGTVGGGQLAPIGKACATLRGQDAIAGGDYGNYWGTQAMAAAIPGGAGFGIARFIEARLSRGKEAG